MIEELGESDLGTQAFWNESYKNEIENFRSNGDVGDIWFGEDIAHRVVRWTEANVQKEASLVDVGCGNGMLLIDLSRRGFTNLTGVDYSNDAVMLAKEVAEKCGTTTQVSFLHCDIVQEELKGRPYDVVLDKGTFDAVSLSPNAVENKTAYVDNISKGLNADGLLIITSCNWTKEELVAHFGDKFFVHADIPTPQFMFGGKVGSVVTCVVFKKL